MHCTAAVLEEHTKEGTVYQEQEYQSTCLYSDDSSLEMDEVKILLKIYSFCSSYPEHRFTDPEGYEGPRENLKHKLLYILLHSINSKLAL